MTVFMLMCYLNDAFNGGIYFKNINDCLYYSERLSDQNINVPIKVEKYECMCKLIPSLDNKKVKVYQEVAMLTALIGPVTGLLDKFIPDADEKARIAHELATMSEKHAQELALSQIEVNKAEAASGSIFKGGWRPAVGWVCAIAFAYHFIVKDLIIFGASFAGVELPELPEFDMGTLLTVLGGMLGIGGLRTYEKQKGLTK